jgi:hypothetical protein
VWLARCAEGSAAPAVGYGSGQLMEVHIKLFALKVEQFLTTAMPNR